MEDLRIKLNPITKLKLFREVKKVIFFQMDNDEVTPERAEEILDYVKKYVIDIETPEKAKQFYLHLGEKFKELYSVKLKFEIEEEEKIEKVFSLLLDEFIEKGNMDLANEIMEQMNETKNQQIFLEKLKINYPIEFQKVIQKTTL
jgi:predicted transcriptional regulator